MDELAIPSTAIYGGNLARTFEYRTMGVHATPHLHWSFPLQEGATITCPVLVAENVVYVGDSAGFFSALDARNGDLLWCFATDWARNRGDDDDDFEFMGVTAICLAGGLGYVASAYHTLYELDLSNGQALRLWNREALVEDPDDESGVISSLLFYDQRVLYSNEGMISRLNLTTGNIAPALFICCAPIIYRHPRGDLVICGFEPIDHSNLRDFYSNGFFAINLSRFDRLFPSDSKLGPPEDPTLWGMGEGDGKEVCDEVYDGLYTVMDETLYAVCDQLSLDGTLLCIELLALDPFTGAVQWRYTILKGEDEGFIQVATASHLIFLVTSKGVEAIDTHTHQQRWTWTSNRDDRHILVADGLLFVLDKAGQITALDALTGEQRWSWQSEQPIKGEFSTIADATLYIVMEHTLCAFR